MRVLTKGAKLDGVALDDTIVGQFVEISGYAIDGNTIQATYIEREDDVNPKTELEGVVTQLDKTNKNFMLNKVKVTGQLPNDIKLGDWVEVEGTLKSEANGAYSLDASEIEIDNPSYDGLLGDDDDLEVEGIVSWISPKMDHLVINQNRSVNIVNVKLSADEKKQLVVGANIEVEGTWDLDAANIKASKIEFDDADDNVTGIESAEFEVPGYAIYNATSNEITINDFPLIASSNIQFDYVLPSQVNGEQWVELSGYMQNDQFIVVEIEDSKLDENVEIEGVVKTFDGAKSLFNYKASDGSLDKYEDEQRVEVKCTLGANNEISQCQLENDDDDDND